MKSLFKKHKEKVKKPQHRNFQKQEREKTRDAMEEGRDTRSRSLMVKSL